MDYNKISKNTKQPVKEPVALKKKKGIVIVNKLYLRKEPEGEQLKILKFSTKLSINGYRGQWLEVETSDGDTGFVMRSFVKEVE